MFKKLGVLAIALALCCSVVPAYGASKPYDFYKVVDLTIGVSEAVVNNVSVKMDQPAFVNEGRTLVPFRFLGESLGAQVLWNPTTKQATLKLSGTEVAVTLDSVNGTVNGEIVKMDVPAMNSNGRLFIPLRFVSENLGANVQYDSEDKSIQVRRVDKSKWVKYDAPNGQSYMLPSGWVMAPSKDDKDVLEVTAPTGSFLNTWVTDKKPSDLLKSFETEYTAQGYTLDALYLDNEEDTDKGYEVVFLGKEKDGEAAYIHIFVDAVTGGSNVGQAVVSEEDQFMDAYVLYQIVSS